MEKLGLRFLMVMSALIMTQATVSFATDCSPFGSENGGDAACDGLTVGTYCNANGAAGVCVVTSVNITPNCSCERFERDSDNRLFMESGSRNSEMK